MQDDGLNRSRSTPGAGDSAQRLVDWGDAAGPRRVSCAAGPSGAPGIDGAARRWDAGSNPAARCGRWCSNIFVLEPPREDACRVHPLPRTAVRQLTASPGGGAHSTTAPGELPAAGYAMSASTLAGSKHFKMFGVLWRPDARSPSRYMAASPSFSRDFEPTNRLVMGKLALRESITLYI